MVIFRYVSVPQDPPALIAGGTPAYGKIED
jgi:hypothetical protein